MTKNEWRKVWQQHRINEHANYGCRCNQNDYVPTAVDIYLDPRWVDVRDNVWQFDIA